MVWVLQTCQANLLISLTSFSKEMGETQGKQHLLVLTELVWVPVDVVLLQVLLMELGWDLGANSVFAEICVRHEAQGHVKTHVAIPGCRQRDSISGLSFP